MSMRNRQRRCFSFALSLVISFAFMFPFSEAHPAEKIVIAHAALLNSIPVYVAVEKGYFKPELDVSLSAFPAGRNALNEVLNGKADVATVAETAFMYAVMNGADAAIMVTISETSNYLLIIGRKDKGITQPGDLKGKKIGVTAGTGAELFLENVLIFNRVPIKEIKKVNLSPEKMLEPLKNGEVDAVVNWDPFARELLIALGANGFAYYGSSTYNRYTWNLVAQKSWIARKPETVKKVNRAMVQAVNFIRKNPAEARRIAAHYCGADESEISRNWESTIFKAALQPSLLMSLEDQARWAIRNNLTDAKTVPNFLNFIYFDGLAAVDPAAVTIAH